MKFMMIPPVFWSFIDVKCGYSFTIFLSFSFEGAPWKNKIAKFIAHLFVLSLSFPSDF